MKFIDKLEPADVIAILIVIGVIITNLTSIQRQFMIPQALLIIVGYYYGRAHKRNGD